MNKIDLPIAQIWVSAPLWTSLLQPSIFWPFCFVLALESILLSPLNSMPEPWPLPYRVFGTSKAQDRAGVSGRGEDTDCTLKPTEDHPAHQPHNLFLKFWEVKKVRFC